MKGEFFMRRIEMFQNDDKSFNADFFASVISSWLNEEIEIKKFIFIFINIHLILK